MTIQRVSPACPCRPRAARKMFLTDFEPIEAGLRLFESWRLAEGRGKGRPSPGENRYDRKRVFYLSHFHRTLQAQSLEPPSTRMVSPVIQRASCEARNATTEPTSSGWPIRLSACMPSTKDFPSSLLTRFDMSVSMTPGATALTRMPRGPSAAAKYFTSVSIAPFVAAYADRVPTAACAPREET